MAFYKRVIFHKDSVTILDSFLLDKVNICNYCYRIKADTQCPECLKTIKLGTLIREVYAHNLLYRIGYKQDRTKDTDLNIEPKYKRFLYFLLSIIYQMFCK